MKVVFLVLCTLALALSAEPETKAQLDEDFGYVEVRTGAHMFWVTYHVDQPGDWTEYPLIMWLQGGPGSSGVGYGNFEELGPYTVDGDLRETAWTKKANVMFVDNPVGTGYSYVEDYSLFTTTNQEIADDMLVLLKSVFTDYPEMSTMPFFIYCESYGGKMAADIALTLNTAIENGEIVTDFRGVALGDSWISPMDSVNTWGPFLYSMGLVNAEGQAAIDSQAATCQSHVDQEEWDSATTCWSLTEGIVSRQTDGVNFYNVLAKEDIYRSQLKAHSKDLSYMSPELRQLYARHVEGPMLRETLYGLMNGAQADRWNIPDGVTWDSQGGLVFNYLNTDFMKPVVSSIERLLDETELLVTVFSGDLDLICDTPGTYRWIENMDWTGKAVFEATARETLHVPDYSSAAGYLQHSGDLALFTILRSGHMVPIDAPDTALLMIDRITEISNSNIAARKANKNVKAKIHEAVQEQGKPATKKHHKKVEEPKETKVEKPEAPKVEKPEASKVEKPKSEEKSPLLAKAHDAIGRMRSMHANRLHPNGQKRLDKRPTADKKIHVKPKHFDDLPVF